MTIRTLFIVVMVLACATPAWSAEKPKTDDFIRFAANGNDLAIDLPGLIGALRSGADPNWINRENPRGTSTLYNYVQLCSMSQESQATDATCAQAVNTLIAAGARLQSVDHSILFWPVARGKTEIVTILLDIGANPATWSNETLGTNLSPVEIAVQEDHQALVELLVAREATKLNERDAIQLRFVKEATYGSIDLLDKLIKQGANVNGKDRDNSVALVNAVSHGVLISDCMAYARVKYLLDAGADPNMSGKGTGGTLPPLHQAVRYTSFLVKARRDTRCGEMIMSELIRRGANVSSRDSAGRTPLPIAAEQNHLFAAQVLLEAGAKVKPRDETGKTPLDFAESGEMIKLRKNHGATER